MSGVGKATAEDRPDHGAWYWKLYGDGLHITIGSYNHDEWGDYNFHGSWYSNNAKDHGRGWFKCYGGTCWVDPGGTPGTPSP